MKTTKVRVVGICDSVYDPRDLICECDELGQIFVDPFVGCALPNDTDVESLLGKTFEMDYDLFSSSGVYLPSVFKEVTNE